MVRAAIVISFAAIVCQARDAQSLVDRVMQARQGAAIVLDVESGRILAWSRPEVACRRLVRPGSTLKPFALLALLNTRRVDQGTSMLCRRRLTIDGRRFDCSHPETTLPVEATAALAYSCNCFFATYAARLPRRELPELLRRIGMMSPSQGPGTEVIGWVREGRSEEDVVLQALGESHLEVTPLAVAEAYRKLALRRKSPERDPGMEIIYAGLEAAVEYGTARLAQPSGKARVAGKTGTSTGDGAIRHAWFAGYGPAGRPQVAVLVFLEQGTGGRDAAPLASEIFRELLP